MADEQFDFDAEFSLLDIGATSSMLRAGGVRPTILAFSVEAGVEAIALDWDANNPIERAFEEARRYVRDLKPVAYGVIAHVSKNGDDTVYNLPGAATSTVNETLSLSMYGQDGNARSVAYPIRRTGAAITLGMPHVSDAENTDWSPLGDVWNNPFCTADTVRFRPRERAVDPSTPLWQAIVELTRMRIHEDQGNSDEYMSFLDDLRNGVFIVAGRPANAPTHVLLRPRTNFNPLGTISVEASRLTLAEQAPAGVDKVTAS